MNFTNNSQEFGKKTSVNVIELFAGVGGFRVGLERANADFFHTIWSNQWEPSTKQQHASQTYVARFGEDGHVNEDITLVETKDIPNHDMLCGGFPCQDYSVARTLSQAEGLKGKTGALWWEIERICREKGDDSADILFLENVDRLLISPAFQRGRDFAIILKSLADLNYTVEWRVINAADYGMPQRRRRTYILAYKQGSLLANSIADPTDWMLKTGIFAAAFPIHSNLSGVEPFSLEQEAADDLGESFNKDNAQSPFKNAGIMVNSLVWSCNVKPNYQGTYTHLGDILVRGNEREAITEDYYIPDEDLPRWKYLKGSKRVERKAKDGHIYLYSEGNMAFPDSLDKPSRTIITSEGGRTPSRFKHVIRDPVNHRLRRLVPIELERLDMFPDNHTKGQNDVKRAFLMGNALVCGIVSKVGEEIFNRLGYIQRININYKTKELNNMSIFKGDPLKGTKWESLTLHTYYEDMSDEERNELRKHLESINAPFRCDVNDAEDYYPKGLVGHWTWRDIVCMSAEQLDYYYYELSLTPKEVVYYEDESLDPELDW